MDRNDRRVLVTGATGFIGSFLVERLFAEGVVVRIPIRSDSCGFLERTDGAIEWMRGDLRDPDFCAAICDGVDRVYHLASHRRNVAYHAEHAADVYEDNVSMTSALIHGLIPRGNECSVVFFSTAGAGKPAGNDGYVAAKAACEELWNAASTSRGFPLLIVRPVNVYGPRDRFAEDGNVIPALMIRAQTSRDHLVVWGSGMQERSFLYVEDLIGATMRLTDAGTRGTVVVASPETTTIRSLAERIRDLCAPGLPLRFDTSFPEGVRRLDSPPAHPALANMSWTNLADGLVWTLDWQRKTL